MWIKAPEATQAQRDKGNEMAKRILEIQRARRREQEEQISTDELSEEELRAYVHSLID